jgi:hypothetical protein
MNFLSTISIFVLLLGGTLIATLFGATEVKYLDMNIPLLLYIIYQNFERQNVQP